MKKIYDLQTHGLRFLQDDELFCFGTDAVELANFAAPRKNMRVCDLGAGSGIISVLLAGKFGCKVTAVEIQERCYELIKENAAMNNLDIEAVNMPMQSYSGHFDGVICNPPYMRKGSGSPRENESERIACTEEKVTLSEVADCAARLLSTGGKLWMVHHITRLSEVITELSNKKLEPKKLQILRPGMGKEPHLFMLECIRDGKPGITVLSEREPRIYND